MPALDISQHYQWPLCENKETISSAYYHADSKLIMWHRQSCRLIYLKLAHRSKWKKKFENAALIIPLSRVKNKGRMYDLFSWLIAKFWLLFSLLSLSTSYCQQKLDQSAEKIKYFFLMICQIKFQTHLWLRVVGSQWWRSTLHYVW